METFDELYYKVPYVREFDATVTSCVAANEGFAVELDQTAFYPTGGGQPGDRGTLTVGAGEDALVAHVREAVPGESAGEVIHLVDVALPVGTRVHGALDWTWRRDNMEAHTGEHIVSGIVHALFGYNNVGFHMGERCIEVDFDGVLTPEDVLDVERRANAAVREDVPVEALLPSLAEFAAMDYRSKKDHEGQIRVVRIEGIDSCACCGTHVTTTGKVGLIKVLRITTKKKRMRLELLCGRRALEACEDAMASLRDASNFLTVADEEVPETVRRLSAEKDDLKHQLKQAVASRSTSTWRRLRPRARSWCAACPGWTSMTFATSASASSRRPRPPCARPSSPSRGTPPASPTSWRPAECDLRGACKELNARLGGRGGGKPNMVQGSWGASSEEAEAAVREVLG